MKINKLEVIGQFKHLQIREVDAAGEYHRRVLTPDMTLADDEHEKIKDMAKELWTDDVKSAWATHKAEQEAIFSSE